MLTSMFKLMVHGITGTLLNTVQTMAEEDKADKYLIFKKLKKELYDETEYRMQLWLPLTLTEKLDMMLHQRNNHELHMMIHLLDQEYDLSSNIGTCDRIDLMLESSLDDLIFQKYKQCARY